MKKYNKFLTLVAAAGLAMTFTSCDDVKENDRYTPLPEIKAERAVLLEDFTGQSCVNCPDAHEVMESLIAQYGEDHVIGVSIHSGPLGLSVDRTNFNTGAVGLMTAQGNAIMETYGVESFPMGVVNMGSPIQYPQWADAVYKALQVPTDVTIDAQASWRPFVSEEEKTKYASTDTGLIEISSQITSGSARKANVQFWIIEDGIKAVQTTHSGRVPDYVHNHVFRAQVFENSIKGNSYDFLAMEPLTVDGYIGARYTDKERWEVKNLSVVVIVSDATGVLQVKKVHVQQPAE